MSKEKTNEEIRDEFLREIKMIKDYWLYLPGKSEKEKMEGLVFSILSTIDGCSNMCGFQMLPGTHPSDKKYLISQNQDYYPYVEPHPKDIAGSLHEQWCNLNPRK